MTKLVISLLTILLLYIMKFAHIYRAFIKKWVFGFLKLLKEVAKNPIGFLSFFIAWCILMSPSIIGYAGFVFFHNKTCLGIAISYSVLTQTTPFPVPIIPASLGISIYFVKRSEKRKNGKTRNI